MKNTPIISGIVIETTTALTLEEICHAINSDKEIIIALVEYQLIKPAGEAPEQWRFDSLSLRRARIAASFYRDLQVNLAGVALALDLLDKIEELENQVNILGKNV